MRAEYAKVYVGDEGPHQPPGQERPALPPSPGPVTATRALNESTNAVVLFKLQQLQSMSLANFVLAVITLVYLG